MECFDQVFEGLRSGNLDVKQACEISYYNLAARNIICNDYYEAIDMILPRIYLGDSATLYEIPESRSNSSSVCSISESISESIRISCGNTISKVSSRPLKYWIGQRVSIFYDPLMIGFASDQQLASLGWGSLQTASLLAQSIYNLNSTTIRSSGKIAVILTRHPSKYAHFVRDRLTKVVWAHYLSGIGPFDEYVFDFPLSNKELQALADLRICSKISYASDLGRLFTIQSDLVLLIEVTTGLTLLPSLRDFLKNRIITRNGHPKVFLSRGEAGSRRTASNRSEVETTMKDLGYVVCDLSELSYVQQLAYCANTRICAGFHGAQMLNGFNTTCMIEFHSFPYCASPWSETMLRMGDILGIKYIPFILSRANYHEGDTCYEDLTIAQISRELSANQYMAASGQTSHFDVDIDNLIKSVHIAESISEKL
jgi:hypothetical protein